MTQMISGRAGDEVCIMYVMGSPIVYQNHKLPPVYPHKLTDHREPRGIGGKKKKRQMRQVLK